MDVALNLSSRGTNTTSQGCNCESLYDNLLNVFGAQLSLCQRFQEQRSGYVSLKGREVSYKPLISSSLAFRKFLDSTQKVMEVIAPEGCGKSFFLKMCFAESLKAYDDRNPLCYLPILLEMGKIDLNITLLEYILKLPILYGLPATDFETLKAKKILLICDDILDIPDLKRLNELAQNFIKGDLKVIIAARGHFNFFPLNAIEVSRYRLNLDYLNITTKAEFIDLFLEQMSVQNPDKYSHWTTLKYEEIFTKIYSVSTVHFRKPYFLKAFLIALPTIENMAKEKFTGYFLEQFQKDTPPYNFLIEQLNSVTVCTHLYHVIQKYQFSEKDATLIFEYCVAAAHEMKKSSDSCVTVNNLLSCSSILDLELDQAQEEKLRKACLTTTLDLLTINDPTLLGLFYHCSLNKILCAEYLTALIEDTFELKSHHFTV